MEPTLETRVSGSAVSPAYGRRGAESDKQLECVGCSRRLPLRLSRIGEQAACWVCSQCGLPFAAMCIRDQLPALSELVRLDERYFDTTNLPEVQPELREMVARIANRKQASGQHRRRSNRVAHSLIAPAISLNADYCPVGNAFNLMVVNISQEGIGLAHAEQMATKQLAVLLGAKGRSPIQLIVQLVRERPLCGHYYESGGEFYVRLGESIAAKSIVTN